MNCKTLRLMAFGCIGIAMIGCSTDNIESEIVEEAPVVESFEQEMTDQYIVTLHNGTMRKSELVSKTRENFEIANEFALEDVTQKFSSLGIEKSSIKNVYSFALEGFVATLSEKELQKLRNDPRVKSIEKDYMITLAPPPGKGPKGGGGGGSATQETPWGITRVGGASDGTGKTAWIIDSGIDLDHPDLNVDTARSRSFVTSGKDARSADDGNGHGTHVAGTVAALDNNIGVIGVAPNAKVVALKVLDSRGSGSFSWTVAALDYVAAVGQGGDAVNMSLGPRSRYTDQAVDNAVLNVAGRGIKLAIAAGNSNDDCTFYSPARVNHQNVYTISASDSSDRLASFSNYGQPVDYAEPGVGVKSTWKGGGYNTISGTSMASPHACGLLLLGNISNGGAVSGDKDNFNEQIGVQ